MRRLLMPLIPLAAALLVHFTTDGRWLASDALPTVQRVAVGAVVLLAWRLRRGRIAWAALALGAAAEVGGRGEAVVLLATLWLLADLAAASSLKEWWFLSRLGALRLAVLGLQATSVLWLIGAAPEVGAALLAADDGWAMAWPPLGGLPFEPLLGAALALSAAACGVAYGFRRTPLEAGLLACCAAVGFGVALGSHGGLRFAVATAAVVLSVALVENAFSLAFNDGLTGLPARRALEERLAQLGRSYALAMLDLDHFKKLNDRHGHEVGDQVLRLVSSRLRKAPGGGEAFRYGGEEFTVVFAGRSADEAAVYLDALRQSIGSRPFVVRSPGRPTSKPKAGAKTGGAKIVEKSLKVTVSIGVAERSEKTPTPETVMKAADRALYKSKKAGRNRVSVG